MVSAYLYTARRGVNKVSGFAWSRKNPFLYEIWRYPWQLTGQRSQSINTWDGSQYIDLRRAGKRKSCDKESKENAMVGCICWWHLAGTSLPNSPALPWTSRSTWMWTVLLCCFWTHLYCERTNVGQFIVGHPLPSLHPTLLHPRGAESKKDTSLWDVQGASPSWIQLKNPLPLPCNQLYLPVSSVMLLASWEKPADVIHMGETFSKGAGLTSRPNSWWKVSKAVNLEKADAPGGWDELTLACKDWWWASLNVTWVT